MDVLGAWTVLILIVASLGVFASVMLLPMGSLVMALGAHYAGERFSAPPRSRWALLAARRVGGLLLLLLGTLMVLTGIGSTFFAILMQLSKVCSGC